MIGKRGGRELEHGLQIGYQFNIIVNIISNLLDIPTGSAFIGTREGGCVLLTWAWDCRLHVCRNGRGVME